MDCSVRRCLFGPVDHERLHQDLKMNHHELFLEACRRWNFDFQTDAPLPGMFEWEKISGGCTATFYQTQHECSAPVLAADDQDMEGGLERPGEPTRLLQLSRRSNACPGEEDSPKVQRKCTNHRPCWKEEDVCRRQTHKVLLALCKSIR